MHRSIVEFYEDKYRNLLVKFSPDSPLHDLGDLFRISITLSLLLKHVKNGIIVDLGCGPGFYIQSPPFFSQIAIGIDISATVLKFAKEKLRATKQTYFLIRADAQNIPLRNESVDCVTIIETLEHVQSDKMAIQEVCRILKKDRFIVISVPNSRPFPFSIFWIRKVLGWSRSFNLEKGHLHSYSVQSLNMLLENEGLKCIQIVAYGHLLLEIMEVLNSISERIFLNLKTIHHSLIFPFLSRLSRLDKKMSAIHHSHGFIMLVKKIS